MIFLYVKKSRSQQRQIQFLCLEDLVPENHIVREIDQAIDFSFIYEEVNGLYSELDWGKPGIDPVCLFKIVFLQYLFGIRSMRQTIKEIEVNMAYRWFIGYNIGVQFTILRLRQELRKIARTYEDAPKAKRSKR